MTPRHQELLLARLPPYSRYISIFDTMPLYPPQFGRRVGAGLVIAVFTAFCSLWHVAVLYAQSVTPPPYPSDPTHYGPEVWFVIAGVLVTVGINLEQLRRVRSDVQDLRKEERTQNLALQSMDHRLQAIEDTLAFLKTRRRSDREYLRSQGISVPEPERDIP